MLQLLQLLQSEEVWVRVLDVNDFRPIIKNTHQLIASVQENLPAGTFVINITSEDQDSGHNGATEIFLEDVSRKKELQ